MRSQKDMGWSMSGGTQLKNQKKTIVLQNITSYWFLSKQSVKKTTYGYALLKGYIDMLQ
jgi:hypothetical protein